MSENILFNKETLSNLRGEITAALAAIGEKYNISLGCGDAKYSADGQSAVFKLNLAQGAGQTNADINNAKIKEDLARYHALYFPDLKLDATYIMQGRRFNIVGYNAKGRKNTLVVREVGTNKQFLTSESAVRNARVA